MTNYKAVQHPNAIWYVTFANGASAGLRQSLHGYETEAKAKRRIRDLNRLDKEAAELQPIPAAVLARDESGPRLPQMAAQRNAQLSNERATAYGKLRNAVTVQTGCYPHVPKHAYRR